VTSAVSLAEIVAVVILSCLFSVGGGNGPIAVVQTQWVESGHLDPALYAWVIALSNLTPGPKVGFLAGVGFYLQGLPGAAVALVSIAIPTCLAAAGITHLFARLKPVIMRIRLPAGFVVAGIIAAAAWQLAIPQHLSGPEILAAAVVAVLVGWRNVEPSWLILGAAALGLLGSFLP
jgi:chromate transporter